MAKIVFLQHLWYEYLGPMYISAVLKKNGHQCEVFIEEGQRKDFINNVIQSSPDIIAFSCLTGSYRWALQLARLFKKQAGALTLFGGIHPTICPEIIDDPAVDIVCRGEGEFSVLELADAIDKGQDITGIENLWIKKDNVIIKNRLRPLLENLDSLPFPDRSLYGKYAFFLKQKTWHFIVSRGCIYRCSYCYNHIQQRIYGAQKVYFRQRSADNVIAELNETAQRFSLENVFFADDIFWPNKQQMFGFLEKYAKNIGLPFVCTITPKEADEDVIRMLKSSGCYAVGLAVESGDEALRVILLKKNTTDEEYLRVAALLHKYGLKFATLTMLGLPGETIEQAVASIKLNWKVRPDYPWVSIFQPFPGMDLTSEAIKRGFINEFDPYNISMSFYNHSVLKQKDIKQLVNLHRLFFYAVKMPRSLPIIRLLIKLPRNLLFDLLFLLQYTYYLMTIQKLTLYQVGKNYLSFLQHRKA